MKKILVVMLMVFLSVNVLAITIGQNITQEQLDGMDIDNVDLEPTWNIFSLVRNMVYRTFDYLFLEETEEGYTVVEKSLKRRILPMEDYEICRTMYTKLQCVDYFKVNSDIIKYKSQDILRNKLKNMQTQVGEINVTEFN